MGWHGEPDYVSPGSLRNLLLAYVLGPVFWLVSSSMQTEAEITKLMGKGEAAARRELMELHGDAVEVDI